MLLQKKRMNTTFIGRKAETTVLQKALVSSEAEMISIIGRRRVGKTFLVRQVYEGQIDFEISGVQNAQGTEQLRNFAVRIRDYFPESIVMQPPKDWFDAFVMLMEHLKRKKKKGKLVVFLDEVPWLATHKSGFLRGLEFFWNSWAEKQDIVVVLCGSAASWMIKKILRSKGGLHNRVTKRIRLQPFNLAETEEYLLSRNVFFDRYQLLQIYMAMGGIPHYLKEIETGKSAVQNINQICFEQDGLLHDEFLSLYHALFDAADYHIAIVQVLATKQSGMLRTELLKATKLPDGGRVTQVLEELTESGFIKPFPTFGKTSKGKIYRLIDEYSIFYLRFIEKNAHDSHTAWQVLSQTQSYKIWSGYAFENICLKHVPQIKDALKIGGVYAITSSFFKKGMAKELGTQIDLVIDRKDHVINLIEAKFYIDEFTISKDYAEKLRQKISVFRTTTNTKKQLVLTLITTFGLKSNKHSLGLVEQDFSMEILFER